MLFLKLLLSIIPTILIGFFIYKKDIVEKESKSLLTRLFIGGCLSSILVIIISLVINSIAPSLIEPSNYIELIIHCFIIVAFVEEWCKFLFAYSISWKSQEFNFLYDAIVYCVFVALGFATVENILYVLQGNLLTALVRAISSVPSHACDAIFMGAYLGLARIAIFKGDYVSKKKYLFQSLAVPTVLHGIYDFFLLTGNLIFFLIFIVFVIIIYVLSIKKVNLISQITRSFYDSYQPNTIPINIDNNIQKK